MGKFAYGNQIDTGGGDFRNTLQANVTGGFQKRTSGHQIDSSLHCRNGHIIKHDDINTALKGFFYFLYVFSFHFDFQGMRQTLSLRLDSGGNAACGFDMICLLYTSDAADE